MQTNNQYIQNGLLVISGKERGRLFVIHEGHIREFDQVIEHPPGYSDNEGFFIRSGDGERYGSGNPRETDDKANLDRYLRALNSELKAVIDELKPAALFIIEPVHLKDKITEHKTNFGNIPIFTVAYGNYVDSPKEEILHLINDYQKDSHDPTDPDSVAGEENAAEKRKILEIAKLRN
jgi:hypothetical protein